jgi:sodium transport system permease protein
MKNNILTIAKKECIRIFSDKKLFFTAVIMPGLLIYVMYTMMGTLMEGMLTVDEDYIYQVHAVNMPDSARALLSAPELSIDIIDMPEADIEAVKQQITDRETDLLLIFPSGFDATVADFDASTSPVPAPNIEIWSNMARSESSEARFVVTGILEFYHHSLTHRFSIQNNELATDADMFATFMGSLIAMMFILFIFTGCQPIAPESIAGEKERGTLGTLLVTPTKRRDMALAKILSISFFGFLSAIGSMVGIALSLPNMMGMGEDVSMDFYSFADFALLFAVAVSTTLVFVSVLSLLSAYAKSVKEATAYTMPFMIISILCGLASMITGGVPGEVYFYLIPIFNSAQSFTAILQFDISVVNIMVTVATNIVFTLICVGALAKLFNSEKIVFDK